MTIFIEGGSAAGRCGTRKHLRIGRMSSTTPAGGAHVSEAVLAGHLEDQVLSRRIRQS
jgi:hypothetical protein